MNEPTIRLPRHTYHTRQVIRHCKWIIGTYIEREAYVDYDWLGSPDPGDDHCIVTRRQRDAINIVKKGGRNGMRARSSEVAWSHWLCRPLLELRDIPCDLDLVDSTDSELEPGFTALSKLIGRMAATPGLTDMAPTKALYLLRPRFVAISDGYVRKLLGIGERQFPDTPKGHAKRAVAVQCAIRVMGQENKDALTKLRAYANEYAKQQAPGLLGEEVAPSKCPVQLSKARVLDILIWAEGAVHGPTPNRDWRRWYDQEFGN